MICKEKNITNMAGYLNLNSKYAQTTWMINSCEGIPRELKIST